MIWVGLYVTCFSIQSLTTFSLLTPGSYDYVDLRLRFTGINCLIIQLLTTFSLLTPGKYAYVDLRLRFTGINVLLSNH